MAAQDFADLTSGRAPLLNRVESIVVDSHRQLYAAAGRPWSRAVAYRWLHYEDPMPVERLLEGVEKLRRMGARFDAAAVDKACAQARRQGFSN